MVKVKGDIYLWDEFDNAELYPFLLSLKWRGLTNSSIYIDSNQPVTPWFPIHLLSDPNFVGSFDIKDKIYFFFRETAVEHINCGKVMYLWFAFLMNSPVLGPAVSYISCCRPPWIKRLLLSLFSPVAVTVHCRDRTVHLLANFWLGPFFSGWRVSFLIPCTWTPHLNVIETAAADVDNSQDRHLSPHVYQTSIPPHPQ